MRLLGLLFLLSSVFGVYVGLAMLVMQFLLQVKVNLDVFN